MRIKQMIATIILIPCIPLLLVGIQQMDSNVIEGNIEVIERTAHIAERQEYIRANTIEQLKDGEVQLDRVIPIEVQEPIIQTWTEEDLEYLACAIYQEAGADYISDKTRSMVGCVIMNRVEHELYPNTIYDVLMQKRQYGRFHWTGIVWPKRANEAVEAHAVQRAYDIAECVLNGERLLDGNYIFQAEFIQSDDYILQDGFYFCRYVE